MKAESPLSRVPAACYEQKDHRGSNLVCEENGRRMIFTKAPGRFASKIRIDGCVIKERTACDYLVHDWKGRYHFVELKGCDVRKAFRQLAAAISELLPANMKDEFWCFVICSNSPLRSSTLMQNA